jgi:WD40 repeat protein
MSQEDGQICVWKSNSGRKVAELRATHGTQLVDLQFDSTGRYLVSVGTNKSHTLNVHEWSINRLVRPSSGQGFQVFSDSLL